VQARRFGLFRVRSPLLAESRLISLPAGTEMVHFPALPSPAYGFSRGYPGITRGGLPHSEISGSKPVCGSPELIAAYHVLHRLLAPRHSPYALSSLTIRTRSLVVASDQWPVISRPEDPLAPDHRPLTTSSDRNALRVRGRKLPFAGYSVVKERPTPSFCAGFKTLFGQPRAGLPSRSPAPDVRLRPSGSGGTAFANSRGAKAGGEYRARTGDLLVANQALSQLS
jgi:hypothetical protein